MEINGMKLIRLIRVFVQDTFLNPQLPSGLSSYQDNRQRYK